MSVSLCCVLLLVIATGYVVLSCRPSAPRASAVGTFLLDTFTMAGAVESLPFRRSPNTCFGVLTQ